MNVFYEEDGEFKVGTVLAEQPASLQVEAPHGKRSKVKAANVLLRFEAPAAGDLMAAAGRAAEAIDVDFLWQCCGEGEFGYESLGRDYFGHAPGPVEAAGLLIRLHGAPMYFYKRGKGRYKAAPEDALRAALASAEKKRQQAALKEEWVGKLAAGVLPDALRGKLDELLYKPDRASLEWKAFEAACEQLRLTPAKLAARCGALADPHDYHLGRFLFEHFPRGTAFPEMDPVAAPGDLPVAAVRAFSIDDAATTEIDDALSVTALADGGWEVGVHIAAPALGVAAGSALEAVARERLSTVYFPGRKITMLPETAIAGFSLDAGAARPAVSCYLRLNAALGLESTRTAVEAVPIAANLTLEELDAVFDAGAAEAGTVNHAFGTELALLWRLARSLEAKRGKSDTGPERTDYTFRVTGDRVEIVPRQRGTPSDKVVSEMMIFVNREWGERLDAADIAAVYRNQSQGAVRMSTAPSGHSGLGVEHYIWASSPLRRYVDLVNQRQIIAWARGEEPPHRANSEALLAAMRDFEVTYDAYAEFQRQMERYWCLKWLLQEAVSEVEGAVIRENLVRLARLPVVARVPSVPDLPAGARVRLAVSSVDLVELAVHFEFVGRTDLA